jgi:Tfp pilus assembly protein PilF
MSLVGQENLAERRLRQMVEEEQRILRSTQRADGSHDEEMLARRYQGLVQKYDLFIRDNAEYPVGYVAYGRLLERIGQDRAARAMYMKANQLDPNIPLVKNQLGNFLAEEEAFAQALPYYLAAIELEPGEPLYYYQLGELLHQYRDGFLREEMFTREVIDRKMLEAFRQASALAPREAAFGYRFAEAFYDLETPRWEEALQAWDQVQAQAAVGLERQTIDLHRANIALKQGQLAQAEALLRTVDEPLLQRNKATLQSQLKAGGPVSRAGDAPANPPVLAPVPKEPCENSPAFQIQNSSESQSDG